MFGFVKQIFVAAMMFFSCNVLNINSLKFVWVKNQECKLKPERININSNEPSFYPNSVKLSKCSGSCNNINAPCAKICISDVVKSMNLYKYLI